MRTVTLTFLTTVLSVLALVLPGCAPIKTRTGDTPKEMFDRLKGLGLGNSVDGDAAIAFECISAQGGNKIRVHLVHKFGPNNHTYATVDVSCENIFTFSQTLEKCCPSPNNPNPPPANTPDEVSVDGEGGKKLYVSCVDDPDSPGGPGKPEIGILKPNGFSRDAWPCQVNGQPNPDLENLKTVIASCCLN